MTGAAARCASYCIAVGVPTRYGVGLVEQAVTDLACEMGAEAVKLGLERLELLRDVSEEVCIPTRTAARTSSALLGCVGSSFLLSIFCLRLSLLAARVGLSWSMSLEADRLAVGVPPRPAREFEGMPCAWEPAAVCEVVLDEDAMDEAEFLGRAVGGVGDARFSMAGGGSLVSLSHGEVQLGVDRRSICSHGTCPCREERLSLAVVMHATAGRLA